MKELLKKAFEAGKDRQYAMEWQMGRKPDFEEWYKEHESQALSIANVVGQSEPCGLLHSTDWNGKCFKCGEQVFVREPK